MAYTIDQFAESWQKEVNELTHLDYFTFKLICKLENHLKDETFAGSNADQGLLLMDGEGINLAFSLGDGLQFFFEKMCFGEGCSLGCPNKLEAPFDEKDKKVREGIVTYEFKGDFEACKQRRDCFSYDIVNYVIRDTLIDFYNYEKGIQLEEEDTNIKILTKTIGDFVLSFTSMYGSTILQNPTAPATNMISQELQQ